jgi:N-acetylmuramoyl-L-alanine amidase
MPEHVIQQGDCITSIAWQYGFSPEKIWGLPQNAGLKKLRKDPNVLFPGDVVFIPQKEPKLLDRATGKRHKFKVKGLAAKLRIRLLDNYKPRKNEHYKLLIDESEFSGQTDGDGWLVQVIPPNAQQGTLVLKDGAEEHPLQLGHLDPIDEISGVQARLRNLGFYSGSIDGEMSDDLETALAGFQRKHNLSHTGQPDQSTKDALKAAYGS